MLPVRVCGCVFCCISLLFVYMCVRMPSSPRSIAGALRPGASGLPYYCTPPVCVPAVLGALAVPYVIAELAVWPHNNKK